MANLNLGFIKISNTNPVIAILLVIAFVVVILTLGTYLAMLALNYVFHLLNSWQIMGQVIKISFMQTFWLILASLIIRIIFFFNVSRKDD